MVVRKYSRAAIAFASLRLYPFQLETTNKIKAGNKPWIKLLFCRHHGSLPLNYSGIGSDFTTFWCSVWWISMLTDLMPCVRRGYNRRSIVWMDAENEAISYVIGIFRIFAFWNRKNDHENKKRRDSKKMPASMGGKAHWTTAALPHVQEKRRFPRFQSRLSSIHNNVS